MYVYGVMGAKTFSVPNVAEPPLISGMNQSKPPKCNSDVRLAYGWPSVTIISLYLTVIKHLFTSGQFAQYTLSLGNIGLDPLFVDADGPDDDPETWEDNNLRLSEGSPCIDIGNNTAILAGVVTDLDGNSRIVNGVVDMVAYELQPSCSELLAQAEQLLALAEKGDVNFDGIVDILDLAILAANWLEPSE